MNKYVIIVLGGILNSPGVKDLEDCIIHTEIKRELNGEAEIGQIC